MKKIFTLAALAAAAVSCSAPEEQIISGQESGLQTITASIAPATKVALSADQESGNWKVSWVDGDALGCYSSGVGQSAFSRYAMVKFDESNSSFSGEVQGDDIRLVYPYDSEAVIEDGFYTVDLGKQIVDMSNDFGSMESYTHLISGELADGAIDNVSMKHLGGALTLNMRFGWVSSLGDYRSSRLSKIEIGVGDNQIAANGKLETINLDADQNPIYEWPTAAKIDLEQPIDADELYSETTNGAINAYLINSPEIYAYDAADESTTYTITLNTLPAQIAAGKNIYVRCFIYFNTFDETGAVTLEREFYSAKNIAITEDLDLTRSTHNTINVLFDGAFYWTATISVDLES